NSARRRRKTFAAARIRSDRVLKGTVRHSRNAAWLCATMASISRPDAGLNVSRTSPVAGLTDCRLIGASFYRCCLPMLPLKRGARNETCARRERSGLEVAAGEAFGVHLQQPVHFSHRILGRAAILGRAQVLEDRLLRFTGFFLLDGLVHGVILAAPFPPD